jgi:hypothetical protein
VELPPFFPSLNSGNTGGGSREEPNSTARVRPRAAALRSLTSTSASLSETQSPARTAASTASSNPTSELPQRPPPSQQHNSLVPFTLRTAVEKNARKPRNEELPVLSLAFWAQASLGGWISSLCTHSLPSMSLSTSSDSALEPSDRPCAVTPTLERLSLQGSHLLSANARESCTEEHGFNEKLKFSRCRHTTGDLTRRA